MYYYDRIAAAQKMGPQTLDALLAATADPDVLTRSLAIRALAGVLNAADTAPDAQATGWRERVAACVVAGLGDPSASVCFSSIDLLRRQDVLRLADFLVPLLGDSREDEYGIHHNGDIRSVGQAAANDFPDDDAALESLRHALTNGRPNAASAWESFVDANHGTEQVRGSARHGEVLVPHILEEAKRGDEQAIRALGWVATTRVLEKLGQDHIDDAVEIFDARDEWEVGPDNLGRIPLRWLYRVGDEFRDADGDLWKIARRVPDADAWRTLVFDVTQSNIRSVRSGIRRSWWNMGTVASLTPVETGTFASVVEHWEAERAREKKIAALRTRHGAEPRPVAFPANATVQQFAAAVGVPTAEVQKHLRERQGRLLGTRDRIEPDALALLADDYNVLPA